MIERVKMNKLDYLESESLKLIKSIPQICRKPAVLWSTGKDSTTMLYLVKKAFGYLPWPVVHIDTGKKPQEVYDFRDMLRFRWNIPLVVIRNEEAMALGISPETVSRYECCTQLKTETLKKAVMANEWDGLILSIRHDEHYVRGMEDLVCFVSGTIIYSSEGIKPIESIRPDDSVFTHTGGLKLVEKVGKRFYTGPVVSISTKYGLGFTGTPNHIVLVKKQGKDGLWRNQWIRLRELKKNDKLFVPKLGRKPSDGYNSEKYLLFRDFITDKGFIPLHFQSYWKAAHSSTRRLRAAFPINPETMRLLGYYIAEGSTSATQANLTFGPHEYAFAADATDIISRYFGCKTLILSYADRTQVSINSKTLKLTFDKLCGKTAHNKHLPPFFALAGHSNIIGLITGCWRGDGSKEKYSTVSLKLANEIRMALLKVGIISSIYPSDGRFHLQIPQPSQKRFAELFDFGFHRLLGPRYGDIQEISQLDIPHPLQDCRSKSKPGGFWVPVKSVLEIQYNGDVYDLKVKDDASYLPGGLVVHNSLRDEEGKWQYWARFGGFGLTAPEREGYNHIRIHPILPWTEAEIWEYVMVRGLPVNPLYFAERAEDGKFYRYRSLGCLPCTEPMESKATTIQEIVNEVYMTPGLERSGRTQDKETENAMLILRSFGYM